MTELTRKTSTADSRIGSHSALSPVIGTSRRRGWDRLHSNSPRSGRNAQPDKASLLVRLLDVSLRVFAGLRQIGVRFGLVLLDAVLRLPGEMLAFVAHALSGLTDFAADGVNTGRVAEFGLRGVARLLERMV